MTRPAAAPARPEPRWSAVRRLLLVRLDSLGDLLMTTPALAAIRAGLPQAHITLLTSPSGAAAADHLPLVDAVWPFVAPWMKNASLPASSHDADRLGRDESALVDRLAEAGFDAAILFTVCTQSPWPMALLCRMAGIPLRLAHGRENNYGLLSDWVPDIDVIQAGMRHEVQRQLDLVAEIGLHTDDARLRFALRPADRAALAARLHQHGLAIDEPWIVVHPGATAASRRWPAERFGHAARAVASEQRCAVVLAGDSGDVARIEAARLTLLDAAPALRVVVLTGMPLGELAVLIAGARLLIANNSAPSHLAAALGTPVVTLYALTNPQHTPWQVRSRVLSHDVPCRWCLKSICPQPHHGCLNGVDAAQVATAANELMAGAEKTARAAKAEPGPELELSA